MSQIKFIYLFIHFFLLRRINSLQKIKKIYNVISQIDNATPKDSVVINLGSGNINLGSNNKKKNEEECS